ncbi:MAG: glycosyltransferase family 39 protein [Bacteroidota bacterium]|nr:glycosyltransferase family 39 protein [Bacteroidota bacterium]
MIIILGVIGVLFACMLAYPFGPDQSIFAVGGELIFKKGALLYRDFLEAKPPVIFYIYGSAIWLFGHHEWSIRALDILYHLLSFMLLYRIVFVAFKSRKIALTSLLFYTIFYIAEGFWGSSQTESFGLLPSLAIVYLLMTFEQRSFKSARSTIATGFGIAVCSIILFLLKYTLLFSFAGAMIFLALYSSARWKDRLGLMIVSTICLLAFGGLFILSLHATGSWENFLTMINYLRTYAGTKPLLGLQTIKNAFYQEFPSALLMFLTPAMLFLVVAGAYSVRRKLQESPNDTSLQMFARLSGVMICCGLLSVLVERKFYGYQFIRIAWCLVPYIAFAIEDFREHGWLRQWKRKIIDEKHYLSLVPGIFLLLVAMFYSPVPRMLYRSVQWPWALITKASAGENEVLNDTYPVGQIKKAAAFIAARSTSEDEIFVWGNTVELYFLLNKLPPTICLADGQFIPSWPPQSWRTTVINQLHASNPKFFVVELNDAQPAVTGTSIGSYEYLMQWDELRSFLAGNYQELATIGNFRIFERVADSRAPIRMNP